MHFCSENANLNRDLKPQTNCRPEYSAFRKLTLLFRPSTFDLGVVANAAYDYSAAVLIRRYPSVPRYVR